MNEFEKDQQAYLQGLKKLRPGDIEGTSEGDGDTALSYQFAAGELERLRKWLPPKVERRVVSGENPVCPTCGEFLAKYVGGYVNVGLLGLGDSWRPGGYIPSGCNIGLDDPSFRCKPCNEDFNIAL